jgi:hypothetical protein
MKVSYKGKGKGKVVPVLNLIPRHEDVWGSGGKWSVSHPVRFTPGKEPPVPIGQEAGWASEPVWTRWRIRKKLLSSLYRGSNPDHPAHSLATILTELPRLTECFI